MAKVKPSLIKLAGTIDDYTIVDSAKYGRHARRKRGTVKPAKLNSELLKSKERLLSSNKPAKLIFDAIRNEHKDGDLWTELLSLFRKQLKEDKGFSLPSLIKLECSRQHSLDKILHNQFAVETSMQRKKMEVRIDLHMHPAWRKKGYLDGYQVSVVVLFPDFKQDRCRKVVQRAPVTLFKDDLQPFHFEVPMPATTAPWILFLGIAGSSEGEVSDVPTTKALAVVKVSGV